MPFLCSKKIGIYRLTLLQIIVTYYVVFPSKFQSSMTNFRYGNVRMQNTPRLKVDELKVSRDDGTRKRIPKKCHSGVVYTMDHEVVPRPSKRCEWTLKSSQNDLGLHQGKNGRVTTEVEVHKFVFLSLLYPLPWSNGFSVGTSKRGGLGKRARAHVKKMPF